MRPLASSHITGNPSIYGGRSTQKEKGKKQQQTYLLLGYKVKPKLKVAPAMLTNHLTLIHAPFSNELVGPNRGVAQLRWQIVSVGVVEFTN